VPKSSGALSPLGRRAAVGLKRGGPPPGMFELTAGAAAGPAVEAQVLDGGLVTAHRGAPIVFEHMRRSTNNMHIWPPTLTSTAVLLSNLCVQPALAQARTLDTTTFAFTSTVPGREVAFVFLRQSGAGDIAASRIETRGDTVYAWTPARLTIRPQLLIAPLRISAQRGEPWFHMWARPHRASKPGGTSSMSFVKVAVRRSKRRCSGGVRVCPARRHRHADTNRQIGGPTVKLSVRQLFCCLWFAAPACDGPSPATAPGPPPSIGVPSVSVAPTGQTLAVGDSLLFQASTNVSGVTGFAWSVSSPATASVTAAGWVRALTSGPVAVTACVVPTAAVCGYASLTVR